MDINKTAQGRMRGAITAAIALAALVLLTTATASATQFNNQTQHSALSTQHSTIPTTGAWQVISPVTTSNLRDVYMASASNGWAVGENGTVVHYNGSAWQVVNISSTDILVDVYMVNPINGYILGWSDFGTEIFKYDGSSWSVNYTTTLTLNSIDGSSANNVWAAGLNGTVHWDGTQWSFVPIPVERMIFNIRVLGDNNEWAFGQYEPITEHGLILHNTGSGWVQVASPAPQTIFDASFTGPDDGWAVGTAVTTTHVHHWDGAQWTWAYTNSLGLFDIFMLSPTDGWAVGQAYGSGPSIAHFYSGSFVQVPNPLARVFLNSIHMVSPYEGWIVGDEGAILYYGCSINYDDVHPSDYFYDAVHYLSCAGVISGYSDNTFRPQNNTTRGQLCKIIVLAEAWPLYCPITPTFSDVPVNDPFFCYIETMFHRQVISGYSDGTFRPYNNVTRAQLSKITVLAEGWQVLCPSGQHFTDVPPQDPFYCFIETAYEKGIISGYSDGTFRPGNNATRGQISKIVYQAIAVP